MNDQSISLPPLPEWVDWPVTVSEMTASEIKEAVQDYARAAIEADRKRRGEPVAWPLASKEESDMGWTLDYRFLEQVEKVASQRTDFTTSMEAAEQVLIAAAELLRAPQTDEPDSAKCAECGAELIPVRPGKWQHPDCSQSPWAAEPVNKTDWNTVLSSWSDDDFVRVFHERPDLADRLRKMLSEPVKRKRQYAQGTALGEYGVIPMCDQVDDEPVKVPSDAEIEAFMGSLGMRWDGSTWEIEDADLHPMVRALLARYGQQPKDQSK